jgi:hypothetical protein
MKAILNRGPFWSVLTAAVLLVAAPATAKAQSLHDCAEYCSPCGAGWKEGTTHNANGEYVMSCHLTSEGCALCPASLAGDTRGTVDLAKLTSMSLSALLASVGNMRERLLVYPERNMVALRGDRCAVNTVVAVVFLPKERVIALAKAGVPTLERFLAERTKSKASATE